MNKRVFVTGPCGFIGSNLVKSLIANGCKVVALARKGLADDSSKNLEIIQGDILDRDCLLSAVSGADIIFHCAAFISFSPYDFYKSYDINVVGTKNILEVAFEAGVKKVVHLSAASVFGYTKDPNIAIDEKSKFCLSKRNPYSYTKKISEDIVREYVSKGLDVSIANIATVYGSGDRKMNSGSAISSIYRDKVKFSPPGGTSYVSMKDLIEGLLLLADKGKKGENYIFCSGNVTFFDLFNRIAATLKRKPIRFVLPKWSFLPVAAAFSVRDILTRGNDSKLNLLTAQIIKETYFYKYYSSNKAKAELGWRPEVSLEEAVKEALNFYIEEGLLQ